MELVELFWDVDDFCREFEIFLNPQTLLPKKRKLNPKLKLSLSEILTIIIYFHQSSYRNFQDYYTKHVLKYFQSEFPDLVSYNRFVELIPSALIPLICYLNTHKGSLENHPGFDRTETLSKARASWYMGDWEALVQLDKADLVYHRERAKLALLAATGHQQLGDMNAARRCTNLALKWGCSHSLVCQVLVSGIYNLLGRGAAAAHQYQWSFKYFSAALEIMKIADNSQKALLRSRVKKQIGEIPFLDTQKVINLVLNASQLNQRL